MSNPFLAEIRMFGGTFAPRGWAFCQAQILSIAQNSALFSLLGTTYGGDGVQTFALPDLRGRVPVGTGQGPGLPAMNLGQLAGSPTHTLLSTEMPIHVHTVGAPATTGDATSKNPSGNVPAATASPVYAAASAADATMGGGSTGAAGGNQPHNIMQPHIGLSFIIALEGIYPSRN